MPILNNPVLFIICLNLSLILLAYLWLYPCHIKSNINLLVLCDMGFIALALLIVTVRYAGTHTVCQFAGIAFHWFWFTLFSGMVLETPFSLWYYRQHLSSKS